MAALAALTGCGPGEMTKSQAAPTAEKRTRPQSPGSLPSAAALAGWPAAFLGHLDDAIAELPPGSDGRALLEKFRSEFAEGAK